MEIAGAGGRGKGYEEERRDAEWCKEEAGCGVVRRDAEWCEEEVSGSAWREKWGCGVQRTVAYKGKKSDSQLSIMYG